MPSNINTDTIETLNDLNAHIDALIAEMYQAFSHYSVNMIQGVYTDFGLYPSSVTAITHDPVDKLSVAVIYNYLDAEVNNTDVLIIEIKHLLPRVIDLFNQRAYIRFEPCLTFDKLYLGSETWKPSELKLVKDFAIAHFKRTIIATPNKPNTLIRLDDLLIMWDLAGLDKMFITSLLTLWQQQAEQLAINLSTYSNTYSTTYSTTYSKNSPLTALNDYARMIRLRIKDGQYINAFASVNLVNIISKWALSSHVINTFQQAVYEVVADSESITNEQSYEYDLILQL